MTVVEMVSLLQLRLGIVDENPLTDANLVSFLNNAQAKVIDSINRNMLGEIEASETDQALVSSTYYPISSLTGNPYGGINGVTIKQSSGSEYYFLRISYEEYIDHMNRISVINTSQPVYYVLNSKVYPVGYTGNLDFFYVGTPLTLVESGAVEGESTETCELNGMLHNAVVDFAESEAWRTLWDGDREQISLARAYGEVQRLNEEHPLTEHIGGLPGYSDMGMSVSDL